MASVVGKNLRFAYNHYSVLTFHDMTPNRAIYVIHQSRELTKVWRELSVAQKREVLKECETAEEIDIEMIIGEVIDGQRRLFRIGF